MIKVLNFTIIPLNISLKYTTLKFIQHTMKENLLLPRDLLGRWKTRFLSMWQLFQKIFILMCYMILLINSITQFIELLTWNRLTLQMILMLNKMKIQIKKILNIKLVIMLEFQNTKTFLLKDTLQISQKKFLLLIKLKIQFLGLMLLVIWMVKKLLEVFMKKNCKKLVKKNLE